MDWIKVEDDLPKEGKEVLVCAKSRIQIPRLGIDGEYFNYAAGYYIKGEWYVAWINPAHDDIMYWKYIERPE